MSNLSSDATDEVEELHDYIEEMQAENRKWQLISLSLALLSVGLTVANTTSIV